MSEPKVKRWTGRPLDGELCYRPSVAWSENGVRWCWGYLSKMTDDPIPECVECERWYVNREDGAK